MAYLNDSPFLLTQSVRTPASDRVTGRAGWLFLSTLGASGSFPIRAGPGNP